MSELRQDCTSGRWVIIAPDRAQRPNAARVMPGFVDHADDPFAEGNELATPGELLAYREPGTAPDSTGWRVRVFPNKFPALSRDTPLDDDSDPLWPRCTGFGVHEVLVECPQFETCLSRLSVEQVREVVRAYRDRLWFHRQQQTCAHLLVFKNKGVGGGATLAHTHSQIIGTPWIPPLVNQELSVAAKYLLDHGRSVWQDLLERELADTSRIVMLTDDYLVLCPFAARVPCETWIIPRFDSNAFEYSLPEQLDALADVLRETLRRMDRLLPDFPYNFVIHSSPCSLASQPGYRWHLEILPRIGSTAGFEWGGGAFINTVPPEIAASQLRSAIA